MKDFLIGFAASWFLTGIIGVILGARREGQLVLQEISLIAFGPLSLFYELKERKNLVLWKRKKK